MQKLGLMKLVFFFCMGVEGNETSGTFLFIFQSLTLSNKLVFLLFQS